MKHEFDPLLIEAIEIITEHLLHTNDQLCGSTEGRKLQHLLFVMQKNREKDVKKPAPLTARVDHEPVTREHLVSRSVDLTLGDDTALAFLAGERGVSRNNLINTAVTSMLDDWRSRPTE